MAEYLTTRELAELLRIKERKVYDLAASGQVPCSRAMGKLLFSRDAIEAWIAAGQTGPMHSHHDRSRPNVFLGSHDPLLEWALRESRSGLATYFDGSSDGLRRFIANEGIATGLHLHDVETGDWNVPQIAMQCGGLPVVLVEWAKRQRGLILRPRMKKKVRELADVGGLRFATRQEDAGAQLLLIELLAKADVPTKDIKSTAVVRSEADAALSVLEEKADVSFGLESLAVQYRLSFVPILEERFDLLVDRRAWFEAPMQTFLGFCRSAAFRKRAADFAGYDVSEAGRVHFNGV